MSRSPAQRRYNRRVLLLSIPYAGSLCIAVYLLSHRLVEGELAYVVAILPALVVSSFFWFMGQYLVEETDEYLRMLQIRQLLIATGITLTVATIWGFLEGFGLAQHVVGYIWPVVWIGALGFGACFNLLVERGNA